MNDIRWFAASAIALAAASVAAASMGSFSPYRLSEIDKTLRPTPSRAAARRRPPRPRPSTIIIEQFKAAGLQPGGETDRTASAAGPRPCRCCSPNRRQPAVTLQPRQRHSRLN